MPVPTVSALVMEKKKETKTRTKCVANGCTSGNRTCTDVVRYHFFPPNPELREVWIDKVGRDDWVWSENSRLCSKHFSPSDYTTESKDTNKWRKKKTISIPRLRDDAVPTLFNIKEISTPPRSTKLSSAEARSAIEEQKEIQKEIILDTCSN